VTTAVAETQTLRCRCGAEVRREIPDDMAETWQDILRAIPAVCDDCIEVDEAREREDAEKRERREAAERRERRVDASGLPGGLRGLSWETATGGKRSRAAVAARAWVRGELLGLLLTGEVGVGKTGIAATAAWELLGHRRVLWTSMPQLFARLGAGHNDRQRAIAVQMMTEPTALVLDDLDKARPTEYGAEQVFAIVDHRITASAPLFVTTNLALSELAARFPQPYGEAIASRLAGYCRVLRVEGPDRRLERAA
jgi:DNA replication protein DnaC